MAENTKIQWTDHTFNPWVGCTKVADGCKFCYAETMMATRYGRVKWGPQGTRSMTKTWKDPLRWNREAERDGEHRKVFCASLADVFEDWDGPIVDAAGDILFRSCDDGSYRSQNTPAVALNLAPHEPATMDDMRHDLFALIDRTPMLDWLLLTKRPENIGGMWPKSPLPWMLRENVWLGTSIATQRDDGNIEKLYRWRSFSPTLFLSIEPQIGPVDLRQFLLYDPPMIDWVIVGGESKQGHGEPRRFDVRWARDLVGVCRKASIPCFVKQFGSNAFDGGTRLNLKDSHGGDMAEWPDDLSVRECPETYYPQLTSCC